METRGLRIIMGFAAAVVLAACGGDGGSAPPAPTAMLVPLLAGAPDPGRNQAHAVSGNGQVVVGASDSGAGPGFEAFRWPVGSAPQGLGFLAGYAQESTAYATNSDGSVVVGESSSAESSRAFIWTSQKGIQPLGDLPEGYTDSVATGVSADGTVVAGSAVHLGNPVAFVWTAERGFDFLGDFVPAAGTTSEARAVSADGSVVVGEARYDIDQMDRPLVTAFRWTRDTGLFPLGWLYDDNPQSSAFAVSSDGSVIGGQSLSSGTLAITEPMRWTPVTSIVTLGRGLVGTTLAASADGSMMAGGAADPGTAFIWDTENGYRNLYGLLIEAGLAEGLEGYSPIQVTGMSSDGTIVVGPALGEGIVRGFFVRLP